MKLFVREVECNTRTLSLSLRSFELSNGSASRESKFAMPAPGTSMDESPDACGMVRMSVYGQKRGVRSGL